MVNNLIVLTAEQIMRREDMLSKILRNNVGCWPVTEHTRSLIGQEIAEDLAGL